MCDMVRCYMFRHAMSDEKCRGDAMWNGVVHVENGGVL